MYEKGRRTMATTASGTRDPRRWVVLGVLILALFGISLDNTVLTIALPTLARDLSASASELQWMVDAYILVFAGLLLFAGAVSDRYGRRRTLVLGLTLFGIGSALAPLVATAGQLIALRAFMGFGAAFTMPSTLSIIADVFDADERPKAIAAWSSVAAIGIVAGPLVGGWLLDHYAWPSVFVVNVPFVVVGIAATLAFVPESRAPGRVPVDLVGAALSVVGLASLVFAIIEVPDRGIGDPTILAATAIAAVALAAFVVRERRTAHPMLDIGLFRDRAFTAAAVSIALVFFALNGALFFITQYLQGVLGLSTMEAGLRFMPIAIGVMAGSAVSALLTRTLGARATTAAGLLAVAGGLALLALIRVDSSDLYLSLEMVVIAAGIGLAMTPATDTIMGALPAARFGVGSAVNDTTREVGGALGVAVLGSLFAGAYSSGMAAVTRALPPEIGAIAGDSLAGASAVAERLGGVMGAALLRTAQGAFVDAMAWTSVIGAVFAVAGAAVAWSWMPRRSASARDGDAEVRAADGEAAQGSRTDGEAADRELSPA